MHHSAHHHGKAVLMITHDPEEVKDYADRNIHLVRNQDSPWRCFNVHGEWSGGGPCLVCYLMTLCNVPFWPLLPWVFSRQYWDLPYLAPSEFDEWYPQSRLTFRCSLWSGTRDFSDYFHYCYCLDCGGLLEYLRTVYKSFMEIRTAILMSTGLAVSLIVMSKGKSSSSMSLDQYLLVQSWLSAKSRLFPSLSLRRLFWFWPSSSLRPMYILTFDEDTAFVDGLPVRTMSILLTWWRGWPLPLWFQLQELFWYRPLWSCQPVLPCVSGKL